MLALRLLLAGLVGALGVSGRPEPSCCAAEKCFASAHLPPAVTPTASQWCERYLHSTPGTVTKTRTITPTSTTVPAQATSIVSSVVYITSPSATLCSTTVTTSLTTTAYYVTRAPVHQRREAAPEAAQIEDRGLLAEIPSAMTHGCEPKSLPQQLSSACRCFLTSHTKTVTATAPPVVVTGSAPVATTVTSLSTSVVFTPSCSSTSTSYAYIGLTCGIANPSTTTSGTIDCTPAVPTPSTNARLRIEAPQNGEGTIFEGCILSGPMIVDTPSGGSHECDGTNNGANPNPGTTPTDMIASAGSEDGFSFDGTYDTQFQDFFITQISQTTQTSTEFWGLLYGLQFTPTGGCQFEVSGGTTETLWAFNAFNYNDFLGLSPDYQVVNAGTTTVTVQVTNSAGNPVVGATIQGGTPSDSNGNSIIKVPTVPGCYQYKATAESQGDFISNAFYLTVLPQGGL